MGLKCKLISLQLIDIENPFRYNLEDQSLQKSLEFSCEQPLVVEGPKKNGRYILIEGYRRYFNLMELDNKLCNKQVMCYIQELTDKDTRVIKRLKSELHSKRKTGFERERMVEYLLNKGYTKKQIADETQVSLYTINKYIKSIDVDKELKDKVEKSKASRTGLTKLYYAKSISSMIRDIYIQKLIEGDILGYDVDSLLCMSNTTGFTLLDTEAQKKCIDRAIENNKKQTVKTKAEKIVNYELLNFHTCYNKTIHDKVFNYVCEDLVQLINNCKTLLIVNLDKEQRYNLTMLVNKLVKVTGIPWMWEEFPNE